MLACMKAPLMHQRYEVQVVARADKQRLDVSLIDGYSLLMYFWYTISCWSRIELIQARHAIFWSSSFQHTPSIQNKVLRSFQVSEVLKAPIMHSRCYMEMSEKHQKHHSIWGARFKFSAWRVTFSKGVYKISDLTLSKLFYISSSLLWQLQQSSDHFLRLSNGNSFYDWPPAAGVPPVMPSAVLCCVMPAG